MAPRHRLGLAVCVAASLLAHGVLWWLAASVPVVSGRSGRSGPGTPGRITTAWQVHTPAKQSQPSQPVAATPPKVEPLPRPRPRMVVPPVASAPAVLPTPETPVSAQPPTGSASAGTGPDGSDDDAYLPRSALTQGPEPLEQIELPYPDTTPMGTFHAVLTLFIDETGQVRRVRVEEVGPDGLPPELEDVARQTFLSHRFTPGEQNGQAVRSQIRVGVDFSSEPAPVQAAPAAPASGAAR